MNVFLTFRIKLCVFCRWNIVVLPTFGVTNKIAHCHWWMAKVILTLLVINTASVKSLSNDTATKKGVQNFRTATEYTRNNHLMVIQNVFVSSNFLSSWCELRAWRENSCWSAYVEYSRLFSKGLKDVYVLYLRFSYWNGWYGYYN